MRRLVGAVALFVLALAVRAAGWPLVFGDDRVFLAGYDAYYHLRRILYSVSEFPAVLAFDPYLNFPSGAAAIWSPAFDWLVAAAALPFVDTAEPFALWRFAAWVPPLLGAATVLVLVFGMRRHFGEAESWLAGVLLALSSGHFWYSQLGFVDHHAAVALVATAAVFAAMRLLAELLAGCTARFAAAQSGGLLAAALLVWPGSLLHVALVELPLAVFLLTRRARADAYRAASALALAHAVAFACVLPFCWNARWPQWGDASPVVLSRFQPWLFAMLATLAAACAAAWRTDAAGASARRRAIFAVAAGLLLLAGSLALLPGLLAGAEDAWRWLARRESFQQSVAESWPIFVDPEGGVTFAIAALRLSAFVFLAPLAIVWLGWRRRGEAPVLLLLAWSAGLLLATAFQRRFFNTASVAVSALFAASLLAAWRALPPQWRAGRLRAVTVTGCVAAAALLLAPSLAGYRFFATNFARLRSGAAPALSAEMAGRRIALETAGWLAVATPPTSGWLDPSARPEYGVLAPWPLGHVIETVGRRPTVVTNFGDDLGPENFARMQRYYRGDETEGAAILDDLGVRYVVAQRGHRFLGTDPPARASLFHALWFRDGARGPADAGPPLPALARHRLVHESQPLDPGGRFTPAHYKVFEFVRGAELVGRGRPGARVTARLRLRTNYRREFSYETEGEVGPDGSWRIRVPYATRGAPPSVEALGPYTLSCRGRSATVDVDESAVRDGTAVTTRGVCPAD